MFDVNPLGLTFHLKELDRQAAPKLYPLRPARPGIFGPSAVKAILLRSLHGAAAVLIARSSGMPTAAETSLRGRTRR